ncbi:MAG: cellulase family glycosylhydrolase [Solirubrobacteraceae bacterium]|nr:cellulase family glycosylhydrolase [Patulibacter sp.]
MAAAVRSTVRALVAVGLLLGAAGAIAQPAAANSKQTMFFEAPRDLTAAGTTDAGRAAAFKTLTSLGVHALRVNLRWYDVAPAADQSAKPAFDATDPAAYAWGAYAATIDAAKKLGWTVLISPSSPAPKWATEAGTDTVTRPKADEFKLFTQAVAKRFGGANVLYSIWNEPNLDTSLKPQVVGGQFVAGRIYRDLFVAGRDGIRTVTPAAKVLFGELAPSGLVEGRQRPIDFLRDALCVSGKGVFDKTCGKLTIDGVADHPYRSIPGIPKSTDDVTYAVVPRLARALDDFAKAGAIGAEVPIYLTQFGIQSYPDKIFGEPVQDQLEERARAERIAYGNPRVVGFSQYLLSDDVATGPGQYGGFESGLLLADGTPKRTLDAFRLVMDVSPITKAESIWGLVRPTTKATTVTIQRKLGKKTWATFKTVKTRANGTFLVKDKLHSKVEYRYRWKSPTLGTLTSPAVEPYDPS